MPPLYRRDHPCHQHLELPRGAELAGQPFELFLERGDLRFLQNIGKQRHRRARSRRSPTRIWCTPSGSPASSAGSLSSTCLRHASAMALKASRVLVPGERSLGAAFTGAASAPSSSSYPRSDLLLSASWAASAWVSSRATSNSSASSPRLSSSSISHSGLERSPVSISPLSSVNAMSLPPSVSG